MGSVNFRPEPGTNESLTYITLVAVTGLGEYVGRFIADSFLICPLELDVRNDIILASHQLCQDILF